MTYRERREAKAARLREWAGKREQKAGALAKLREPYEGDIAFWTQPGNIPERTRLYASMERSWEHSRKAEGMTRQAAGIEAATDRAIYSDDPDAIEQLEERIVELEAERGRVKAYNASCRQRKGEVGDLSLLTANEKRVLLQCLQVQAYACKNGAFPGYHLTNLSGNIKRQRDRLEQLKREAS